MLTFSELIAYDLGYILVIFLGIICIIGSIYIYLSISNKQIDDKVMISILLLIGLMGIGSCGMMIINSNIISTTITPCSISGNLVADTSDTIYSATPEYMIKLHINETKNILVYQMYLNNIPKIVHVAGSGCPSTISGC